MALRFPADPKADRRQAAEAYHGAMREVVKQFPTTSTRLRCSPNPA
jgi:hypothetical protein